TPRLLRPRATVAANDPAPAAKIAVGTGAACPGGAIFCFTPAAVTVRTGDTVEWTNTNSGAPHTVTRCSPAQCEGASGGTGTDASFTSVNLDVGGAVNHTFTAPGTYVYYCMIHGYALMHGAVVVQSATTPTSMTSGASGTGLSRAAAGTNAVT